MRENDDNYRSSMTKEENEDVGLSGEEELAEEIYKELETVEEEDDENPEWDGSTEAEYVEDDDAEEYEIPEMGIKLSYVLTRDEMYKCLYNSDIYKTKGTRAVVQSVIFGLAAVAFFLAFFFTKSQYNNYYIFFGGLCLVMIAAIWIVPHLHLKNMAKMMADGKTIEAEIYPTHIDIGRDDGAWSIELDGKSEIKEFDNIFMICTPKGQNFAIPERVIEPEVYNEIKAILFSGTVPVQSIRE